MNLLKMSSLTYFIPYENIVFDYIDPPWIPWISSKMKRYDLDEEILRIDIIRKAAEVFNCFKQFNIFRNLLAATFEVSKQQYYTGVARKLMNSRSSPKTYWSLLKTFRSKSKIPCIPPLYHNNKFVTNFKEMTINSPQLSTIL